MVIEQQQILTTQNLAQLFSLFNWKNNARVELEAAVVNCFTWICKRQQLKISNYHAKLVMVKNTAYAWRQLIFFLSQLEGERQTEVFDRLQAYFLQQPAKFRTRFEPMMLRLSDLIKFKESSVEYIFTGWTTGTHRLLKGAT